MLYNRNKLISLALVLIIVLLSLTACSDTNKVPVPTEIPAITEVLTEAPEPTEEPTAEPTVTPNPEEVSTQSVTEEAGLYGLEPKQLNAIGMLNYLAVLLQDIKTATGNRVYLQEMFTSLSGNTHPDVVDPRTQSEITDVLSTLSSLRMLAEKREHLAYIYDQKRANAIYSALPNPLSVLNVIQSAATAAQSDDPSTAGAMVVASLVYMAADAVSGYLSANAQNELQFLDENWDLEEKEKLNLDKSQIDAFNYLMDMKNEFNLKGDQVLLTLNEKTVRDYTEIKNTENLDIKIRALLDNQKIYEAYGDYWLLLADCYYEKKAYQDCLDAVSRFEELNVKLFRKDFAFARILPKAIIAADQVLPPKEYEQTAVKYLELICDNTYIDNWDLRYFVSITYLDLYGRTNNTQYLEKAYEITRASMNRQISKQIDLNKAYMADVSECKIDTKNLSDQKKKEAEEYNRTLEENRKKELPPIYEPLWLNCNLLYGLADLMNVPDEERSKLDGMLHGNETALFLNSPLDDYFWFKEKKTEKYDTSRISYGKGTLVIPAIYVHDNSEIAVELKEKDTGNTYVIKDWVLEKVERKNKNDLSSFVATYKSENGAKYDYGCKVIAASLTVQTGKNSDLPVVNVQYHSVQNNLLWIIPLGIHFESDNP